MNSIYVTSEIGKLKKVIIHTPGPELEAMTPETAVELLYDDILNLPSARKEHEQLKGVLDKISETLEVESLLKDILAEPTIRQQLLEALCRQLGECESIGALLEMDSTTLAAQLIRGTLLKRDTLERFLSPRQYALPPLPNLFFTRDTAMVINDHVFIGNMANRIRIAEAVLMSFIFRHHPAFLCQDFLIDASKENIPQATFEGGDLLILQEDTVLIGMSERTSPQGIDYLVEQFKKGRKIKQVFAVMLPRIRATIHLDMIFTMINYDKAVVFPPLILAKNALDVIHINMTNPKSNTLKRFPYLLDALRQVDINLEPVYWGGSDELYQKREQWQSGANFFTIAPGKIIGYGMNTYTFLELAKAGIPRVEAEDVLTAKVDLNSLNKYAVAISGNELNRGGGGCRCMTLPILRDALI